MSQTQCIRCHAYLAHSATPIEDGVSLCMCGAIYSDDGRNVGDVPLAIRRIAERSTWMWAHEKRYQWEPFSPEWLGKTVVDDDFVQLVR